jgi:hypothetical protein
MKQINSINGQDLREMFAAATTWLEKSASDIDALNVYPVPDGDTGTNMLLTMRSVMEEAYRAPDRSASAIVEAMAKGALVGARGNSGVILSQFWRGLAQGLEGKESFNSRDLAEALLQATKVAYKGLSHPVEGTILTVIKDVAKAAQGQITSSDADMISVVEAMVRAANESVANTPNLLQVLRDTGVVDAGGQGLHTILEGALHYLKGEVDQIQFRRPQIIVSDMHAAKIPGTINSEEVPYGYCTEFLLKGENLDPDKLKNKLGKQGESLIVVGDESTIRIHIHTLEPGNVIKYATSMGTMHQVSVRNMNEQHRDYLKMQKERMPEVDIAIVAVASGKGIAEVLSSLGTAAVAPGGQTMNPSTKDLLEIIEPVPSDKIIILPNNKNIVPTANQIQLLTKKNIQVIPTETIPQGVAAILAFDFESDLETNIGLMNRAKSAVKSVEITRAVRSTKIGEFDIKKKQAIGLLDGELVAVGNKPDQVLSDILAKLQLDKAEVVTIYHGADAEPAEAEQISSVIFKKNPHLQIEVVDGGQPHYNYIVSVE